jgi:hypothetical protein
VRQTGKPEDIDQTADNSAFAALTSPVARRRQGWPAFGQQTKGSDLTVAATIYLCNWYWSGFRGWTPYA